MDIYKLSKIQREFDKKHGWTPNLDDALSIFHFLQTDTIGLCGEVGELAGIVKRIDLEARQGNFEKAFSESTTELNEELIDVLIYLIRILDYLNVDIEKVYKEKLNRNELRFKKYERK